jgi:ankyrin repeat protein
VSPLHQFLDHDDGLHDLKLSAVHRIVLQLSNVPLSRQLQLHSCDVNVTDWLNKTALIWASMRADESSVQILLDHGADPNLTDWEGRSPLHHAASVGSYSCVESLLNARANPKAKDVWNLTPLHAVVHSTRALRVNPGDIVKILQKFGARINEKNDLGWTPLYYGVRSDNPGLLQSLIDHGADINAQAIDGTTALHHAICLNNCTAVQVLCENSAKDTARTSTNPEHNILNYAATYANIQTMRTLAATLFDRLELENEGQTPWRFFEHERNRLYVGERAPLDEERAALQRLLEAVGTCSNHVM